MPESWWEGRNRIDPEVTSPPGIRDEGAMASPLVRRAAFEQVALAALRVVPNGPVDLEPSPESTPP